MAKDLNFKDYHASVKDADGDKHDHAISVGVVDKDTAGEYRTRTGVVEAKSGDVLVPTGIPGVYDYHTASEWREGDYKAKRESVSGTPSGDPSQDTTGAASGTDGA
jgi:hypothetical protein